MAYCSQCGAYIPAEETTCPACGFDPAKEEARRVAEEMRKAAEARRTEEIIRKEEELRQREEALRQREKARQSAGAAAAAAAQQDYSYSEPARETRRTERSYSYTADDGSSFTAGKSSYNYEEMRDANERRKRLSILSYIPVACIIPALLDNTDDAFVKFHASQGFNVFLLYLLGWILSDSIFGLFTLAGIFGTLKGLENVKKGRLARLPYIGDLDLLSKVKSWFSKNK